MAKIMKHHNIGGVLFVIPSILVLVLLMTYPLIYTFFISLNKSNIFSQTLKYVGISQYLELFKDPVFILSIKNTLVWTFSCVLFQFVLGFIAAITLNQNFIKVKALWRIILLVSWVTPSIVCVMVWKWMFHADFGIVNAILKSLGIISENISWLAGVNTAFPSVIVVNVWKMFPFVILMIEAALQGVSKELQDSARIDGANSINTFLYVTIPHIRATCIIVILLLTIWALNAFTFIFVLTRGGPIHKSEIGSMFIYKAAFINYNFGIGSAAGTILFLITAIFSIIYMKVFFRRQD